MHDSRKGREGYTRVRGSAQEMGNENRRTGGFDKKGKEKQEKLGFR
jgi:hypothetical protein